MLVALALTPYPGVPLHSIADTTRALPLLLPFIRADVASPSFPTPSSSSQLVFTERESLVRNQVAVPISAKTLKRERAPRGVRAWSVSEPFGTPSPVGA